MNKSIILINPFWEKQKGSITNRVSSCLPSFGLGYIAGTLYHYGIDVKYLDYQAVDYSEYDLINEIESFQPDFVGITATTVLVKNTLEIARVIKQAFPHICVIVGGVHATICPEEILNNPYVDIVVRGEGEFTMLNLCKDIEYENIPGISYKTQDGIKHNCDAELVEDLDIILMPAYHLMPMNLYHTAPGSALRHPSIGIFGTRGCPAKCTYCYSAIHGKNVRKRSPENIIDEIKYLQKYYGIKEVSFYDDTFILSKSHVLKFCELLKQKNIDLTWTCMARVDNPDKEILKAMKKAGCHQICYGIESASEEILKNIKKRIKLYKAEETVRLTKEAGINVRLSFMLGNPGETVDTIKDTINLAVKLEPDIVHFNITTPYPGTEMYQWAKQNNYLITKNWEKYNYYTPIMNLPTISPEDLMLWYRKAFKKFFFRPKFILKKIMNIRKLSDLKIAFKILISVIQVVIGK